MLRILLSIVFLALSHFTFADGVRWQRACLDFGNNVLNLEFVLVSDCDSALVHIYGERSNGAGFRLIGKSSLKGENDISLTADNSGNWKLYLTYVNKCTNDSVVGKQIFVDNTPPQNVGIDSVSVMGESVQIGWTSSTSNDVKNYVLYYEKDNGLSEFLDTVGLVTEYVESSDSLDANGKSETYRIAAFDSCNISTGLVDAHSTVFLRLNSIDFCERNFNLERTTYRGWENDDVEYKLVYKPEGDLFWKELNVFDFNDLFLSLPDLKINFEIKVRAINSTKGFTSSSNVLLIQFGDDRTLEKFYINHIEFTGKETKLKWETTVTDLVDYFSLEYSETGKGEWAGVKRINANDLGLYTIVLDNTVVGRFYRLLAVSDCQENIGYSNHVKICGLKVSEPDSTLKHFNLNLQRNRVLNWNSFTSWEVDETVYTVYRKLETKWILIKTLTDTFYTDSINLWNASIDSGICYRVIGTEKEPLIDGDTGKVFTNEICLFFDFHGDLPNAFIQDISNSKLFKIPVENLDTANSYITIYNRWGELVLENELSWNGCIGNNQSQPCPEGVYYYIGRIQLLERKFYFISSTVKLFR